MPARPAQIENSMKGVDRLDLKHAKCVGRPRRLLINHGLGYTDVFAAMKVMLHVACCVITDRGGANRRLSTVMVRRLICRVA